MTLIYIYGLCRRSNNRDLSSSWSLSFEISSAKAGKEVVIQTWPVYSSVKHILPIVVSSDEFASCGLKFSMNYAREFLVVSVGDEQRAIHLSKILYAWREWAPFACSQSGVRIVTSAFDSSTHYMLIEDACERLKLHW